MLFVGFNSCAPVRPWFCRHLHWSRFEGSLASISVTDDKNVEFKTLAYCAECIEGQRILAYFPALPAIAVVAMLYVVMMGFDFIRSFV